MADDQQGTSRHKSPESEILRIELFSDGVLAIALSLLALDLSVTTYQQGSLSNSIIHKWPTYASFLVSFIYVAVMWMNHHATFHRLRAVNFPLMWANMGVLLGAVVLSYPTALLSSAFETTNVADQRAAVVLYGLVAFFMGLSWCLLFFVIDRSSELWVNPNDGPKWRQVTLWAGGGACGYLLAVAAGVWISPILSLVMFFVLVAYRSTQAMRINRDLPAPEPER